jgi:signal transduction histidine kinase
MGRLRADLGGLVEHRWAVLDGVGAVGLAAAGVLVVVRHPDAVDGRMVGAVAFTIGLCLPVAWRRRAPAAVLAVTALSAVGLAVIDRPSLPAVLTPALALYSLAAAAPRRASAVGLGFALLATATALLLARQSVTYLTASGLALVTAWAVGANARTRRAYLAELRARARRLAADRDRSARLAAAAERQRIARELHDMVTHNVTVMVISAGAARMVADADPDRLRAELASVEQLGRQTLTELRRLLGVLRADDAADPREPQPGLARLDALLARTREAGLPVELVVEGRARPLPQGIDVSAFRIVQEALSNTLRHAGDCSARVEVGFGDTELRLAILDDGRGDAARHDDAARPDQEATGHGIVGMRERVAMIGGDVHIGSANGGGFAVRATLPLDGA